ncbi:MAG: IS5 family transposase [Acidobacteriota bacterium]|nr:IS5 family transposase [Acidobacteriota bacterium]
MRGDDEQSGHLFSYLSPEQRVPVDHPLRVIRAMTDEALRRLSSRFELLYAQTGRPSVPPEHLLRALLLQVLYSIRSERLLMEQLEYNLLFRWFVGLAMDDTVWTPTTFTKNRERLLAGDVARAFFEDVVEQARGRRLLSDEHFTIDGTLLEAWAGQKSFRRKDQPTDPPDDPGNPTVNFHGERRSNATHQSTTDPDSRLFKKARGHEAKLGYLGEVLMENRHGLVVDACVVPATGTGEREAAVSLIASLPPGYRTVGGDKGYDTRGFVTTLRALGVTPHIAAHATRHTVDRRTTRHVGYGVSQRARKRIEEVFGWMKTVGGMRKLKHRGGERVNWQFLLAAAAYNLVRMRSLMATT